MYVCVFYLFVCVYVSFACLFVAVEGDNKKETKGAKAAKGKADQSRAIKAVSSVN